MSYRDDRDALLARNTALEQENERLRRQNAELQARLEEPPRAPRSTDSRRGSVHAIGRGLRAAGRGLRALGRLVHRARVPLAIGVVVLGGIVAFARCGAVAKAFRPDPSIKRAMIVDTERGAVVAVLASYTRSGKGASRSWYELSSFDVRSGKEVGVLELDRVKGWSTPSVSLFKPVGARIWARHNDGKLALLDLRGPTVEWSRDALVAEIPELAAGYQIDHTTINDGSPPTPGVRVTLHDGRTGWVDMTPAFVTSQPPTEPWLRGHSCGPDAGAKPSCLRTECIAFAALPGTSAYTLSTVSTWTGQGQRAAPSEGASPLLRPGLVKRLETECAFEADDSVLVLHDTAALDPKETVLSLVERATGQIRWTRNLAELTDRPGSNALGARVVDGEIVLLLHERRATLDLVRLSLAGDVLARHRLL